MKIGIISKTLVLIFAILLFAGCFSIESSVVRSTKQEHVLVSNYGWYLFHFIPLACGNASEDPLLPLVMFRNDVTMDKIQKQFFNYAKSQNKEAMDLVYSNRETVLFEFPGSSVSFPVPYILTYREIQLSGVLMANKGGGQ